MVWGIWEQTLGRDKGNIQGANVDADGFGYIKTRLGTKLRQKLLIGPVIQYTSKGGGEGS